MEKTTHFNLNKPGASDYVRIEDLKANMNRK